MSIQLRVGVLLLLFVGGLWGIPQVCAQEPVPAEKGWYPKILKRGAKEEISSFQKAGYSPYLPDFSYAGYRWGEKPLPEYSSGDPGVSVIDVTDAEFGAIPDDGNDDTQALKAALQKAHQVQDTVVVRFPPGRFILREILFIEKSNIVLQGSGRGKSGTEIYVPRPLREMEVPEGYEWDDPDAVSPFSWNGGVIWTRNPDAPAEKEMARLIAGRRGQHTIRTDGAVGGRVQEGDVVQIEWYNRDGKDGELLHHIYCAIEDISFGTKLYDRPNRPLVKQEVTIKEVQGETIRVKEPLLHDLRKGWTPRLTTVDFLENVGVEHLSIVFPKGVWYGPHLEEDGYNGLFLTDLLHSWVQDVSVRNSDSGIIALGSKNITVRDVDVGAGRTGHYSIQIRDSYGALVTDFLGLNAWHNPSFQALTQASVYSDGVIREPRLDQHMALNHQNLFDNLRTTEVNEDLFSAGGDEDKWGPVAGAFNTFWNIRIETNAPINLGEIPSRGRAPHSRLVGVRGTDAPVIFNYDPSAYVEGKNREGISIPSLYEEQLRRRLNGEQIPSLAIYNPLPGYRFERGDSIPIEAEVSGDFVAERVRFIANGDVIGVDSVRADGWGIVWENPPGGNNALKAKAYNATGEAISARPQSCSGTHVGIWVGREEVDLGGNYPNPFGSRTVIDYTIARSQQVRVEVYDIQGRKVRVLLDEFQRAGDKNILFKSKGLSSGIYFYHISGEHFSRTKKMVVLK
jgi:hypothetical protein